MKRNAQLDLRKQHIEAGLDPYDLKNLDTPPKYERPTTYRGVSID
jgi:hypothetical protein